MRYAHRRKRLSWTLVFLAWFAQLCLPVAHAAMQAAPSAPTGAWCGDPAGASQAVALLPAEIREALDLDAYGADHLATCAKLCAVGSTPSPLPATDTAVPLPAMGAPLAPARQAPMAMRRHALPPPSHGPPAQA